MMYFCDYATPLGTMLLQAREDALLGAWFADEKQQPKELGQLNENVPILCQARQQLTEYFAGQRQHFQLALDAKGTVFQEQVWAYLRQIPYGETRSYQDLAIAINNPKAVRAVGLANGKNPLSIIVPCHRVIGKNGQLTGYAGGVERKAFLLTLEQKIASSSN